MHNRRLIKLPKHVEINKTSYITFCLAGDKFYLGEVGFNFLPLFAKEQHLRQLLAIEV